MSLSSAASRKINHPLFYTSLGSTKQKVLFLGEHPNNHRDLYLHRSHAASVGQERPSTDTPTWGLFPHPSWLPCPRDLARGFQMDLDILILKTLWAIPIFKTRRMWALGAAWCAPEFQEHQIPALLIPRQEQPRSSRWWESSPFFSSCFLHPNFTSACWLWLDSDGDISIKEQNHTWNFGETH